MKIKTSELTGVALDWAVAKAQGLVGEGGKLNINGGYGPSTSWSQGGPIVEREKIHTFFAGRAWFAEHSTNDGCFAGPTLLIAAMRCFCCTQLGDEVEVPDELT